jgi:homogentisate 1,2-dioxygenase
MNQGFGNIFCSEAIQGALPLDQNSPKQCAYGLYAEQISGSAFTRARHQNFKTWVYRLTPSVANQNPFRKSSFQWLSYLKTDVVPMPLRLSAPVFEAKNNDLISGVFHIASSGQKNHVYWYDIGQSMKQSYFCNYDSEMLFIPVVGKITLATELGKLCANPGEIIVIPKGIAIQMIIDDKAFGYLAENGGLAFRLPELGPIGANGLAHPRHFTYPDASFEDNETDASQWVKYQGVLWERKIHNSPLNVVAWHGNYAPYHYNLDNFNAINTVSFDHPDPSIYTVLTSESEILGIANLDFVVFPKRWTVAKHTFRLPYFHRNIMSELMGLIEGQYDAKAEGFKPGGISIHNKMIPHGPDLQTFQQETKSPEHPSYIDNTLAFMLESNEIWQVTEQALNLPELQKEYTKCWQGFPSAKIKNM